MIQKISNKKPKIFCP